MKRKLFLLFTLLAVLSASSVTAQMTTPELNLDTPLTSNLLKRSGFSRFTIGEQSFSFRKAGYYIEDWDTAIMLRRGIIQQRVAVGFGIATAPFIAASLVFIIKDYNSKSDVSLIAFGMPFILTAGMTGITAIALGISGSITVKKAIKRYNSGLYSDVKLSLAPTSGGLGLQLTF
jgi:hypothetical protein